MTSKELAHSAQLHLETSTGGDFKRAHIYELLAASFGFNSYAALGANSVFTEQSLSSRRSTSHGLLVHSRCVELGYPPDIAKTASVALPSFLSTREIGVIRISDLVAHLRSELGRYDATPNEDIDTDEDETVDEDWIDIDYLASPILLDGLAVAANKDNADAHYALALIHAPGDDDSDDNEVGSEYWYAQAQNGRVLTGVEKEWAETHAAHLVRAEKYVRHLQEAARLGQQEALLELADRFDDPTFFEQPDGRVDADPVSIADIAARLGRPKDARKWLVVAAESGDTEAMRQLIEEFDHGDPLQCWTWVYLAELVGKDLTKDEHYAINKDGSSYDDDVGGPAYVGGREGVELIPISTEQSDAARRAAQLIFQEMKRMAG